ncbi:hypothetical protein [Sphingomonas crocodyli]|uniref:Uncharacterized protein n=1 Tax=Sphingomonas crocodyli TaxID=1979270 RepID=A0A437M122_9SPHN|nr:hypothetical protein [Sphingomonas crocodyli]RVT91214.1 hypothetical protein EOD43_17025 [Sphingomonas crocodyli]
MPVDVLEAPSRAASVPAEPVIMPASRPDRRPSFRMRLLMIVALNSLLWGAILWALLGIPA